MPDHSILDRALRWSGALRRKTDANAAFTQWLAEAATQTVTRKTIQDWFLELKNTGSDAAVPVADAKRILRQLRQRVFFTLMVRDINMAANLHEVVTGMTALADLAVADDRKSTRLNSSH